MKQVQIAAAGNGRVLCSRAAVAATFLDKLIGLRGRRNFEPGEGLLIRHTSAIHTMGVTFPIDVIALDSELRVLAIRSNMKPSQVALFALSTDAVLELPAGQVERAAIRSGDVLTLSIATPSESLSDSDFEKDLLPI